MAIVKCIASGCPMNNIFPYVMNESKTENGILVSGIHCTPESALDEFRFVKNKFGKTNGRQYYHIVQSFSPDDKLTPETAHEIGLRFAEYFPGYQIVVATHCDRDHLHNHLVMNSVNMENGKKFHQTADDLARVKEYSNQLCREYGLFETEAKSSFGSMPKWKDLLRRKAYSVACAPPAKKILSTRWRCTATRWTGRRDTSILPSPRRTVINAVTTSSLPSSFCEKIWRFIFSSADVSRDLRSSTGSLKTACIRNTVIQWAKVCFRS